MKNNLARERNLLEIRQQEELKAIRQKIEQEKEELMKKLK